jgi:hypothetical protein
MATKRNQGKYPHEIFFKSIPSIAHFRRTGCIGWVFLEEEIRKNKLTARAVCCSLVGYSTKSKAYRLVDIYTCEIFFKSIPSIAHFRRTGCIGWVFLEEEIRKNKLTARAVCCSLVGYSTKSKAYRLVDIYT